MNRNFKDLITGDFKLPYKAAAMGTSKIEPKAIKQVNVAVLCDNLNNLITSSDGSQLPLKISAKLSNGLCKILNTQVDMLQQDVEAFLTRMETAASLPVLREDTEDVITVPKKPKKKRVRPTARRMDESNVSDITFDGVKLKDIDMVEALTSVDPTDHNLIREISLPPRVDFVGDFDDNGLQFTLSEPPQRMSSTSTTSSSSGPSAPQFIQVEAMVHRSAKSSGETTPIQLVEQPVEQPAEQPAGQPVEQQAGPTDENVFLAPDQPAPRRPSFRLTQRTIEDARKKRTLRQVNIYTPKSNAPESLKKLPEDEELPDKPKSRQYFDRESIEDTIGPLWIEDPRNASVAIAQPEGDITPAMAALQLDDGQQTPAINRDVPEILPPGGAAILDNFVPDAQIRDVPEILPPGGAAILDNFVPDAQIRQEILLNKLREWYFEQGPLTLRELVDEPHSRQRLATAFMDLLDLRNKGFLIIERREGSYELRSVVRGPRLIS